MSALLRCCGRGAATPLPWLPHLVAFPARTHACLRGCSLMKELKELLTEGSSQVSAAPQAGNM
jgi:hypothetical protein